ncbi:unnamed protein product [Dibothriocephalus latus]|uniref:VHS domain-containing protein n=1 Tax=Dibothriocephalus latus TaxID=60516 RepID=A0A3P7NZD9_DIBLA|nr:unnamed protein product [Dibothriocephalus latus]
MVHQLEKSAADYSNTTLHTLELINMCMKNCGYRLRSALCDGDHLQKLEKLITGGKCVYQNRTRILALIKVWHLAFPDPVDLTPIHNLYRDLLASNVTFPEVDQNQVDTLRRMETADRLKGCQRRLEAYIGTLSDSMNPKSENIEEKEAAFAELMRVNEKIQDSVRLFRSFEKMLHRENEKRQSLSMQVVQQNDPALHHISDPTAFAVTLQHVSLPTLVCGRQRLHRYGICDANWTLGLGRAERSLEEEKVLAELMRVNDKIQDPVKQFHSFEKMLCGENETKTVERSLDENRSEAAGTSVTIVENQPETSSAASSVAATAAAEASVAAKTNAAVTELTEKNDISQTLSDARETIQRFQMLQQQMNMFQAVDATQRRDLEVVVERLKALEKKVHALITASISETSTDSPGDDDTDFSKLASLNDELHLFIENYQQTIRRNEVRMHLHLPLFCLPFIYIYILFVLCE